MIANNINPPKSKYIECKQLKATLRQDYKTQHRKLD